MTRTPTNAKVGAWDHPPPLQQLVGVLAHRGHKENLVFII